MGVSGGGGGWASWRVPWGRPCPGMRERACSLFSDGEGSLLASTDTLPEGLPPSAAMGVGKQDQPSGGEWAPAILSDPQDYHQAKPPV